MNVNQKFVYAAMFVYAVALVFCGLVTTHACASATPAQQAEARAVEDGLQHGESAICAYAALQPSDDGGTIDSTRRACANIAAAQSVVDALKPKIGDGG